MAIGDAHIKPQNNYYDGRLTVAIDNSDVAKSEFVYNETVCYSATNPVKVPLHIMVIDEPEHVSTYTDQLTFKVEYVAPTTTNAN